MTTSLVDEAFHQEDDETVASFLKVFEDECRQIRPLPPHLNSRPIEDDFRSPSSWLLQGIPQGGFGGSAVENVEVDDEILDLARELQFNDHDQLEDWVGCTQQWLSTALAVREEIEEISGLLGRLIDINAQVVDKSSFLTKNAAGLIAEKDSLEKLAQQIETKLQYFEKVDSLAKEVSNPQLDPFSHHFHAILAELDEVIDFLNENRQFKSAGSYVSRVHIVQQRALMVLRDLIVNTCQTIQSEIERSEAFTNYVSTPATSPAVLASSSSGVDLGNSDASSSVDAEGRTSWEKTTLLGLTEVLNAEFQAKLDGVLPLIRQLEQRCKERKDSQVYLNDILAVYYDGRIGLLSPLIGHYLTASCVGSARPLTTLVQQGIPYLLAIVVDECKLFHQFFSLQTVTSHLKGLVEGIGLIVYEKFRSFVLKVDDLKDLAQVVDSLRNTLLLGKLKTAGEGGQLLSGIMHKMIQDAQERFIFRSSMYIRDVIGTFRYTYADVAPFLRVPGVSAVCLERDQHFPTLGNTLALLKLMWGAVEKGVFEGLAQEAVTICTDLLVRASDLVLKHAGKDKVEWPSLEAALFLVRHLLTLREHLVPYDANLTFVERHLDLSQLVQARHVAIQEKTRDPKKDLEEQLRKVCERFITECSERITAELGPLILKVQGDLKGSVPTGTVALQASSSAQFQALKKEYATVLEAVKAQIHTQIAVLKFYLPNPLTMNILFRPVKGSVLEVYQPLHTAFGAYVQKYNLSQHATEANPALAPRELLQWAEEQERLANATATVTAGAPPPFSFDLQTPTFASKSASPFSWPTSIPDSRRTSSSVGDTPTTGLLDGKRPPPLSLGPMPGRAPSVTTPATGDHRSSASTLPVSSARTTSPTTAPPLPSPASSGTPSSNGIPPLLSPALSTPPVAFPADGTRPTVAARIPKPTLKPSGVGGAVPRPTLKPMPVGTATTAGRLPVPKPQVQKATSE
eukprot:GGOE01055961.1.p1 GENE.GGOE01055961.1~~GGOE01055961.1.p1  ORF type:complete len:976 (-),score=298.90 GGOE01055961.1:1366-4272(-)